MLKLKYWIIRKIFERQFKYFVYPFEKADETIRNLKEAERFAYYLAIRQWKNSKAYKIERQEKLRTYYQRLSVKTQKEPEFSAYRLCIEQIQKEDLRLTQLIYKFESEYDYKDLEEDLTNKEK